MMNRRSWFRSLAGVALAAWLPAWRLAPFPDSTGRWSAYTVLVDVGFSKEPWLAPAGCGATEGEAVANRARSQAGDVEIGYITVLAHDYDCTRYGLATVLAPV
jgi:hypothetical protein